jgi:hypothetical protein
VTWAIGDCETALDAIADADAIVLVTEWPQ